MTTEIHAALTYNVSAPFVITQRDIDRAVNACAEDAVRQLRQFFPRSFASGGVARASVGHIGDPGPEAVTPKTDAGASTAQTSSMPAGANGAPRIIGFAGRKHAGKSTAADVLIARGWEPIAFADPLKRMILDLLMYQGASRVEAERLVYGDGKEEPTPYLGGRTSRHAQQKLGHEWGRESIARDLWTGAGMRQARQHQRVVFRDVRYDDEAQAIRAEGGVVFWIDRDGLTKRDWHASERSIGRAGCDGVILNTAPSEALFRRDVRKVLCACGFIL